MAEYTRGVHPHIKRSENNGTGKDLNRYYITFGSDERFPFQNTYICILAESEFEANQIFRAHHPNRPGSDALNYSFLYTESEFLGLKEVYYPNTEPAETLTAETCPRVVSKFLPCNGTPAQVDIELREGIFVTAQRTYDPDRESRIDSIVDGQAYDAYARTQIPLSNEEKTEVLQFANAVFNEMEPEPFDYGDRD